jgi:hypothetical protein
MTWISMAWSHGFVFPVALFTNRRPSMTPSTVRSILVGVAALVGSAVAVRAQHHHDAPAKPGAAGLGIPTSIGKEHSELHERLARIVATPGDVGVAAKAVAELLHEHFEAEELFAMPLLGTLQPLANHAPVDDAEAAIAMAKTLREKMPQMLDEHRQIKAALDRLREVSVHLGDVEAIAFADALMLHAQTEEEVLYPAALLAGDALMAAHAGH